MLICLTKGLERRSGSKISRSGTTLTSNTALPQARWALDHHDIKHSIREYTPFVGTWCLRWRLRDWSGKITVPVLITPSGDGLDYALYWTI